MLYIRMIRLIYHVSKLEYSKIDNILVCFSSVLFPVFLLLIRIHLFQVKFLFLAREDRTSTDKHSQLLLCLGKSFISFCFGDHAQIYLDATLVLCLDGGLVLVVLRTQ